MARFDLSQYSTVAERIDKFWKKYPSGRLHTELVHFSGDRVVIKAEVYLDRDDARPVTIDFAEESLEVGPMAKFGVETCSTSAIGRALADLGGEFTGAKRPSVEEMAKVARHEARQSARDWLAEAEAITDVDKLRLLWAEASQAGAPQTVLGKVKARAEQLAVDGKRS